MGISWDLGARNGGGSRQCGTVDDGLALRDRESSRDSLTADR
jgi:hypothetical protein